MEHWRFRAVSVKISSGSNIRCTYSNNALFHRHALLYTEIVKDYFEAVAFGNYFHLFLLP